LAGSPSIGRPGSAELPDGFDAEAALPDEPWKIGEDEMYPVRVLVDSLEGPRVAQQLGEKSVSETRDDGSVVVELQVSNEAALISWVLALGPHAEVLSPPQVRAGVVEHLRSFAEASRTGDS
jgi:predicted DNA-binding transcriptional regulator YafY